MISFVEIGCKYRVPVVAPVVAVLLATFALTLSGCGAGGVEEPSEYVRVSKEPTLGAVLTAIDTDSLVVPQGSNLDTSRSINIELDIAHARDNPASVSVCTDFLPGGGAFDVDYTSCGLQGDLVNGRFNRQMLVTNEYDTVAVVVWFRNSELAPVYQEITVDSGEQ